MDSQALQRLLIWLSPAFPVGSFAWSGGLETAIAENQVRSAKATEAWVKGSLEAGAIATDAILLAHAYGAAGEPELLGELADLSLALTASAERHAETTTTGRAFLVAAAAWGELDPSTLPDPCPYPVAVGALAGRQHVPLSATLTAFIAAVVHAQVSVAVRLVPIGQTAGLTILAALEDTIAETANRAHNSSLEQIGTMAYAADIAQMRHETLQPRLFRS